MSCLEDGNCQTDQTQVAFGEKLYINERGACICHSGEFICDTAADFPEELDPGLYISLGYSLQELKLFKEKVTKKFREKSGLISPDSSIVKDIVSRLQFALERVMPKVFFLFSHQIDISKLLFLGYFMSNHHFG